MNATNCGLSEGTPHAHVNRCYIAGAVEALRAAADAVELEAGCTCETCETYMHAVRIIRERANRIAGGVS